MTSFEIRRKFLNFFRDRQHKVLPSSSLIPKNDPSLLFVNAGMNQFKNVFLGLETLPYKNVVTVQKCLRAGGKHNDMEEVGETAFHHTFFEMLGNFSFGGYFKKQASFLAWQFLTKELGLDPKDLWISVYHKDEESYEIWRNEHKIPGNKIYRFEEKDNFWQMGETGPSGPCTEIHYYKGDESQPPQEQLIEIWNLVFMEFYDMEKGGRQKLPIPCVDTGMGLERLSSILQNEGSNYHTDLFKEILFCLEKLSTHKYNFKEHQKTEQQKAFRVLVDHSRAIAFLINDGVQPGNEKENYVLRRIIRRALYYGQKLSASKNLLQAGVEQTISHMSSVYPSLKKNKKHIQSVIEKESVKFFNSLKVGRKKLEETMQSLRDKTLDMRTVWNLYSTYGFPMDLTLLIAREKGWDAPQDVEILNYEKQQKQLSSQFQKNISKTGQKEVIDLFPPHFIENFLSEQQKTIFTGYEHDTAQSQILFIASEEIVSVINKTNSRQVKEQINLIKVDLKSAVLKKDQKSWLITDKSCFYPEGGGAISDKGFLKTASGYAEVSDCQKKGDFIWHKVKVKDGSLKVGQDCHMEVYTQYRQEVAASHTATHLLHATLRDVLGSSVRQAGSLVEPGRLRFDFTYHRALSQKECHFIEEKVWQSLERAEELFVSFKDFKDAEKEGALFLQGENYEHEVRVVSIGENTSKELCGGIHVKNTRDIKSFKIVSEKGIQAGVRRIVAYTGSLAKAWENFLAQSNLKLREYLQGLYSENMFFLKDWPFLGQQPTYNESIIDIPHKKSLILEKKNPFLSWLNNKEEEAKALRKKIICLDSKEFNSPPFFHKDFVEVKSYIHPLVFQVLELREYLKMSLPRISQKVFLKFCFLNQESFLKSVFEESEDLLKIFKVKNQTVQKLKSDWNQIKSLGLTQDKLIEQAKEFQISHLKGKCLIVSFPLTDRRLLLDISQFLLSKLSHGVLVLLGEAQSFAKAENKTVIQQGKEKAKSHIYHQEDISTHKDEVLKKYPVLVSLTKNFEEVLSASDILKKIILPLCKGKGGGKPGIAQGSIQNKKPFENLEKILLNQLGK